MLPPLVFVGSADTDGPLSKWQTIGKFPSLIDCNSWMTRQQYSARAQFGPITNAHDYYEAEAVKILNGQSFTLGDRAPARAIQHAPGRGTRASAETFPVDVFPRGSALVRVAEKHNHQIIVSRKMGHAEIIAYFDAKPVFDLAKAEVQKLAKVINAIGSQLEENWRDVHPEGMPIYSDYGLPRSITFNPQQWPDGQRVSQVLRNCHDSFRALLGAYKKLSAQEKQTLGHDAPPQP
jgi:hypothetical protein